MPDSDVLLRPYLECPDEQLADDLLAGLLFEDAEPVVLDVLRRRLRSAARPQDHEELAGEVILELLARLRRNRDGRGLPDRVFPCLCDQGGASRVRRFLPAPFSAAPLPQEPAPLCAAR